MVSTIIESEVEAGQRQRSTRLETNSPMVVTAERTLLIILKIASEWSGVVDYPVIVGRHLPRINVVGRVDRHRIEQEQFHVSTQPQDLC